MSITPNKRQHIAERDHLYHNTDRRYGENLFVQSALAGEATGASICRHWYDEQQFYDFEQPGFARSTGNFTAMIWRRTQRLGVGRAHSAKGNLYVVVNYDPAGNVLDMFPENVFAAALNSAPSFGEPTAAMVAAVATPSDGGPLAAPPKPMRNADFAAQCLEVHNMYRWRHGADALELSAKIGRHAQEWAEVSANYASTCWVVFAPLLEQR